MIKFISNYKFQTELLTCYYFSNTFSFFLFKLQCFDFFIRTFLETLALQVEYNLKYLL